MIAPLYEVEDEPRLGGGASSKNRQRLLVHVVLASSWWKNAAVLWLPLAFLGLNVYSQ